MQESDSCCGDNCSSLCKCLRTPVLTRKSTAVSEGILMYLGSMLIECGFEFGWNGYNNQTRINNETFIKESILSSGASATYAVIISIFLKIMHDKYGDKKDDGEDQIDRDSYSCTATLFSQLLAGALSFGAGMLFDYAFYKILDDFSRSSNIGLAFAFPTVIVSTQVLARYGIFKVLEHMKNHIQEPKEIEMFDKIDESLHLMGGVPRL